ncbi:MAG: RNA ligase [Haloferacaceae archaeon]
MGYADLLGVDADEFADVEEHFEYHHYRGAEFRALPDARHGLERGTVLVDDTVVRGYPSVPRTLVLDPGVPEFFDGPVAVTEKLDGFNVRVVALDEPYAFTRGGYICPFTTDRARALLDLDAFFADHPGKMLCAEFVGPETPYTDHDYPDVESHDLFVFDVRDRVTGEPMPVEPRRELADEYGFRQPRSFGVHEPEEAVERVAEVIEDLHAAGREGVVMRSLDGRDQLKYTTSAQHRSDLRYAFSLPFDYGRDFMFPRLVREGFQAVEFGDGEEELRERARALGESILLPMVESIRAVRDGEAVGERHTVRGDPEVVDRLFEHFADVNVVVDVEADRREGDERVVTFLKRAEATTDQIRAYLDGTTIDE